MTEDRWLEIIGTLEEKGVLESRDQVKVDDVTSVERVVFTSNGSRMKLELTRHPKEIDKKTFYSKRIGASVGVTKTYSTEETVLTLKAFRWDEHEQGWVPFAGAGLP